MYVPVWRNKSKSRTNLPRSARCFPKISLIRLSGRNLNITEHWYTFLSRQLSVPYFLKLILHGPPRLCVKQRRVSVIWGPDCPGAKLRVPSQRGREGLDDWNRSWDVDKAIFLFSWNTPPSHLHNTPPCTPSLLSAQRFKESCGDAWRGGICL